VATFSSQDSPNFYWGLVMDPYKVLGVDRAAPNEVIQASYRALAKKFHPDLNPGRAEAAERFIQVVKAYEAIGDQKSRDVWDRNNPSEERSQTVKSTGEAKTSGPSSDSKTAQQPTNTTRESSRYSSWKDGEESTTESSKNRLAVLLRNKIEYFGSNVGKVLIVAIVIGFTTFAVASTGMFRSAGNGNEEVQNYAASVSDADITSGCWKAKDRGVGERQLAGDHQQWKVQPQMVINAEKTYKAEIETNAGKIEVEFFPKDAPIAVNNFVCLARTGYFDGTPVHRIVKDFVVQGGDPTGTGRGGPGYRFADEPVTRDYLKGTLAMANAGPDTNGSQFFICTADLTGNLAKDYSIFGQVTSGMDIVDKLNIWPTQSLETGAPKSSPIEPVIISKVTVSES